MMVQPLLRVLLVYIIVVVKMPISGLLLERIIPGPILLIPFVPVNLTVVQSKIVVAQFVIESINVVLETFQEF